MTCRCCGVGLRRRGGDPIPFDRGCGHGGAFRNVMRAALRGEGDGENPIIRQGSKYRSPRTPVLGDTYFRCYKWLGDRWNAELHRRHRRAGRGCRGGVPAVERERRRDRSAHRHDESFDDVAGSLLASRRLLVIPGRDGGVNVARDEQEGRDRATAALIAAPSWRQIGEPC